MTPKQTKKTCERVETLYHQLVEERVARARLAESLKEAIDAVEGLAPEATEFAAVWTTEYLKHSPIKRFQKKKRRRRTKKTLQLVQTPAMIRRSFDATGKADAPALLGIIKKHTTLGDAITGIISRDRLEGLWRMGRHKTSIDDALRSLCKGRKVTNFGYGVALKAWKPHAQK